MHLDIWHRGAASASEEQLCRHAVKFVFERTTLPTSPSWDCECTIWKLGEEEEAREFSSAARTKRLQIWLSVWEWMLAAQFERDSLAESTLSAHMTGLLQESTAERLDAAYSLGRGRNAEAKVLGTALRESLAQQQFHVSRDIVCGLIVAGLCAAGDVELVDSWAYAKEFGEQELVVFALGQAMTGSGAALSGIDVERVARAMDVVLQASESACFRVQAVAMSVLGYVACWPCYNNAMCEVVLCALLAKLCSKCGFIRSCACAALARMAPSFRMTERPGVERIVQGLVAVARRDADRYAQGYALEALERFDHPLARKWLVRLLKTARWCSHTSSTDGY